MNDKTDQKLDLDNLNLDTNEMTWNSKPLPHNPREVGSKAIMKSALNHAPNRIPSQSSNRAPGQASNTPPKAEKIPKPAEFSIPKPAEAPLPTPDQLGIPSDPDQLNNLTSDSSFENLTKPDPALSTPVKQNQKAVEEALNIPFDKAALKTTDKLDQSGIAAVDMAVEKLNQDGDVANFYDIARQMMEANLDNSYNRKIGEGLK